MMPGCTPAAYYRVLNRLKSPLCAGWSMEKSKKVCLVRLMPVLFTHHTCATQYSATVFPSGSGTPTMRQTGVEEGSIVIVTPLTLSAVTSGDVVYSKANAASAFVLGVVPSARVVIAKVPHVRSYSILAR